MLPLGLIWRVGYGLCREFSRKVRILLCAPLFAGMAVLLLGLFLFVVVVVVVLVVLVMKLISRQRLNGLD